jgi:hypothetical protein
MGPGPYWVRGDGGDPDCIHAHPNLETRRVTKEKEKYKRIATDRFLKIK